MAKMVSSNNHRGGVAGGSKISAYDKRDATVWRNGGGMYGVAASWRHGGAGGARQ